MAKTLIRHGSNAGYNAETVTGNICERCRAAHRVYQRQYSKAGRAAGIKYSSLDVIDHLDKSTRKGSQSSPPRPAPTPSHPEDDVRRTVPEGGPVPASPEDEPSGHAQSPDGATLRDKLGEGLRRLVGGSEDSDGYVPEDGPDYLHSVDPDPEPAGDFSEVTDEEFVINKAGMDLIADNLGTYMSVIGITAEMIDPYCGPILAENFDNIVSRWTRVIARYPKAAKLFMSKDGGTIFVWIGAIQATWPVLLAIYEHHLARSVQTDKQGRVYRVQNSQNGQAPEGFATAPQFNYTVD